MAGQIHVDYDKVDEIIGKLYCGIYPILNSSALAVVGKRDRNGGLTAGFANKINSVSTSSMAPHTLMKQLERSTAIMLKNMAEEMRSADEAAKVK